MFLGLIAPPGYLGTGGSGGGIMKPPGLGGGFKAPPPPVVKTVGGGILGGAGKIIGGALAIIAKELLFPPPVAKADLTSINPALLNVGTETVVEEETVGDPPFLGGQVLGANYKFKVRYDVYLGDNIWIPNKLSTERIRPGPIYGFRTFNWTGTKGALVVQYRALNGTLAEETIDTGSYNNQNYRNYRFEYLIRADGTTQEGDINQGGNPPGIGGGPPILTISGIDGLGEAGFATNPKPISTGGAGGAISSGGSAPTPKSPISPITPPPGLMAPPGSYVPPPSVKPPSTGDRPPSTSPPPTVKPVTNPTNQPTATPTGTTKAPGGIVTYTPTAVPIETKIPTPVITTSTSTSTPTKPAIGNPPIDPDKPTEPKKPAITSPGEPIEAPLGGKDLTPFGGPINLPGVPAAITKTPPTINTDTTQPPTKPPTKTPTSNCPCGPAIQTGTNQVLDGLNLLGQGVDLSMLNTINSKLGDQVPGGLSGWLSRFSNSIKLDRVMNTMSLMVSLHNASMLSRSLVDSLSYFIDSGMNAIGLKDEDDNPLNIGEYLGGTASNFIKGLVGEDMYNGIVENWKKLNTIYQSAVNVFELMLSATAGIAEGLETTAQYTGKIGNALRKSGTVLENSYQWMDENIRIKTGKHAAIDRVIDGLQTAEEVTSNLTEVTETISETTETVNQIKGEVETIKSTVQSNVDAKTATENTAKTNSASPDIQVSDLTKPTT